MKHLKSQHNATNIPNTPTSHNDFFWRNRGRCNRSTFFLTLFDLIRRNMSQCTGMLPLKSNYMLSEIAVVDWPNMSWRLKIIENCCRLLKIVKDCCRLLKIVEDCWKLLKKVIKRSIEVEQGQTKLGWGMDGGWPHSLRWYLCPGKHRNHSFLIFYCDLTPFMSNRKYYISSTTWPFFGDCLK